MKKLLKICSPTKGRSLKVMLPKVCNYRCSYCFQEKTDGQYNPHFFTNDKLETIGAVVEKFNIERIVLIGGEPTLFDLFPLIKNLRKLLIKELFIITNFSPPNDYFIKIQKSVNEVGSVLKLCCSLHEEFVDYKLFVDKVNELFNQGVKHVAVEFVVAQHNLNCCFQIINYIKNKLYKDVFVIVDCDMFDENVKRFYETHQLNHTIKAKGLNLSLVYEDGNIEFASRQELRLKAIPVDKYCLTDLVLSESNMLSTCFRSLRSADELLEIDDLFLNEEKFKCSASYCRFCDNPQIFFEKENFKELLKAHRNK